MKGAGRPLRFLLLVFGAWIGLRTWQLWPEPPVPAAIRDVVRRVAIGAQPSPTIASVARPAPLVSARVRRASRLPAPATRAVRVDDTAPAAASVAPSSPAPRSEQTPAYLLGLLGMIRYGTPAQPEPGARRWSASGWAMLRGGGGAGGGVATPQLGGAQAGIRIARTLDSRGRLAIAGRIAAALDTRQQEAAVGLEWRPTALPVRVVAERRFGIADQRAGTALGLVGGVSDRPLPGGFRLEGYAQAGMVIRDGTAGYADGALHVTRPVMRSEGGTSIAVGLGAWGGAQRDAERLDVGPVATIEVPLGSGPRLRIALEWRQRIAGAARPASGPALSIGTDY